MRFTALLLLSLFNTIQAIAAEDSRKKSNEEVVASLINKEEEFSKLACERIQTDTTWKTVSDDLNERVNFFSSISEKERRSLDLSIKSYSKSGYELRKSYDLFLEITKIREEKIPAHRAALATTRLVRVLRMCGEALFRDGLLPPALGAFATSKISSDELNREINKLSADLNKHDDEWLKVAKNSQGQSAAEIESRLYSLTKNSYLSQYNNTVTNAVWFPMHDLYPDGEKVFSQEFNYELFKYDHDNSFRSAIGGTKSGKEKIARDKSNQESRPTQNLSNTRDTPSGQNKFTSVRNRPSCKYFDGFKDNGDGTVTDPRNGLVWKRCAEGQTWAGSSCTGFYAPARNWYAAMVSAKQHKFLEKSDWRLPNKDEALSILGSENDCSNVSYENGDYIFSNALSRKLDTQGNPLYIWTYNESTRRPTTDAAIVSFYNGQLRDDYDRQNGGAAIRLVRQPSGGESAMAAFNAEYNKHQDKINTFLEEQRSDKKERELLIAKNTERELRINKIKQGDLKAAKSCVEVAVALIGEKELGGNYEMALSKDFQDVYVKPTNKLYAGIGKIIDSEKSTITLLQSDKFRNKQFVFQLRHDKKTIWFGDTAAHGAYLTFVGRYIDNTITTMQQGANTVKIPSRVYDVVCVSNR